MALYKYSTHLTQSPHDTFDAAEAPGTVVNNSGIYRCTGCGDECACNKGNPLPPQNNHQHAQRDVPIRWQLLVCAVQL
jgi:hypothetical protein